MMLKAVYMLASGLATRITRTKTIYNDILNEI